MQSLHTHPYYCISIKYFSILGHFFYLSTRYGLNYIQDRFWVDFISEKETYANY